MSVIYIAGPMTGKPNFNRKKFIETATHLWAEGHTVLNPAMLPDGLAYEHYMDIGFAMLRGADEIYLLDGWQHSAGATAEHALAKKLGLKISTPESRKGGGGIMILKPMGTPGKCPVCVRAWTPEEDELLVNLYPHMTSAQIATMQDRSIKAVEYRVRILRDMGRLTRKRIKLTPGQCSFIRANRLKMTAGEVADVLGIPINTVWREIRKQNISYRKYGDFHHSTKRPDSDVDLIRQLRDEYNLTFREIGEKFDISADYCQHIYYRRHTAIDAIAREYLPR
ncbi:DUF4406 domain-containing protein [Salmonella enterica subsp. enterica serovar Hvittingfoss]|nr:DUF4406 domain-containing protein [Salmonella enterica subsp. enterica serovar Hvittingfoss]EEO8602184.1 DUF4406 domain-containing protein [Salmonella enterica]EJQ3338615.1 DUF4406 domain-containing protein [Salmonella enterica subsp. enterica serovar Johannesburg]EKB5774789.1 DUF4406 domain-containing protein [Salmonella enterica subsp. enterica serovar Johannesburg]EKF1639508.1 DUF4406 domain-containing protein [Salmonella enterica]